MAYQAIKFFVNHDEFAILYRILTNGAMRLVPHPYEFPYSFGNAGHFFSLNDPIPFNFVDFGPTNEIRIFITAFWFSILGTEEHAFLFLADCYRDPRSVFPQRTWEIIMKIFR
jgi:hypothetical protein